MGRRTWWVGAVLAWWVPASASGQSMNMGATFHDLERRAERVVVAFEDAEVETTRGTDGRWQATLRNPKRRVQATLDGQSGTRSVRFRPAGAPAAAHDFELAEGTEVGLDWAALQVYVSWHDQMDATRDGRLVQPADGVWDGHVRRDPAAQARGRSVAQLVARVREVRTTFPRFEMRATLDEHTRTSVPGKRVDYSKFTTRVVDRATGKDLGFIRWFDTAQVLTWKIEGGGSGVVLPERLRGGWTFTPSMAWANVQAFYFATRPEHTPAAEPQALRLGDLFAAPAAQPALGQVAWLGPVAGLSQTLPWRRPLAAWGAPALAVNEPGCDNLHWLDHTIFRLCCDRHDYCYEKNGCSASSWRWPFSGTWQCAACNAYAVYCFCTFANPYHCGGSGGGGGGDDDSGDCTRVSGGFCPVECQSCTAS